MAGFSFILNLPWTIIGIFLAVISLPYKISPDKNLSIVFYVRYWWWARLWMKNARAANVGHVILLGQKTEPLDKEHELVHVSQYMKYPLIFPALYYLEIARKGYRNNRFEAEAYSISGNRYAE